MQRGFYKNGDYMHEDSAIQVRNARETLFYFARKAGFLYMDKVKFFCRKVFWSAKSLFFCPVPGGVFFGIEGLLFSLILLLANNNNGFYLSQLKATSIQLGLNSALPPLVGVFSLIPFTMLTDRVKNKRPVVAVSVLVLSIFYSLTACVGFFPDPNVFVVLAFLAMVNIPMSLYNSSWQSFFSDTVSENRRNDVFTFRTRMNTIVTMIAPVIIGAILSAVNESKKIMVHQIYYFLTIPIAVSIGLILRKADSYSNKQVEKIEDEDHSLQADEMTVNSEMNEQKETPMSLKTVASLAKDLFRMPKFRSFILVAILLQAGWTMDWSLGYQAQKYYFELSEIQMNILATVGAFSQFLFLGVWSRLVSKKGSKFVLFIGSCGFIIITIGAILGLTFLSFEMPVGGRWIFYIAVALGNIPFSAFLLSLLQCFLECIPTENRSMTLSIYNTILMSVTAIMPFLGVVIYNALGETLIPMIIVYGMNLIIRVLASLLSFRRWKKEEK